MSAVIVTAAQGANRCDGVGSGLGCCAVAQGTGNGALRLGCGSIRLGTERGSCRQWLVGTGLAVAVATATGGYGRRRCRRSEAEQNQGSGRQGSQTAREGRR